jgi:hypothetical protein
MLTGRAIRSYRTMCGMELSARDLAVVQLVGRFGQLASTHIGAVLFDEVTDTPLDRSLARLVRHNYLRRVGRRSTDKAGSGGFVYELGRVGWAELGRPEGYRRKYGISNHALKVADVFVALLQAERAGQVELIHWQVERPVGEARADLYAELGLPGNKQLDYCLEIDLGTERSGRIRSKLDNYWRAYTSWQGESFPYVAFLVPDKYRKFEIERVINRLPEGKELFSVHLLSSAVSELLFHN